MRNALPVSLFLVLACTKLLAYEAVTFLEPDNLVRMRPENGTVVRVSAVKDQSANWHFKVAVTLGSAEAGLGAGPRGILEVFSNTNAISVEQRARAREGWIFTDEARLVASTTVEGTSSGKTVGYQFTVSDRYLRQSKFTVIILQPQREDPSPTATDALKHYWFYLVDFVNRKGCS